MTTTGSHRVLVGVDGSPDALRAVHYAMCEAQLRGATLQIVHAVDAASLAGPYGVMWDASVLDEAATEIMDAAIAQCVAEGFPREHIDPQVLHGTPGAILTQLSQDADLAVVGRRAISGLERIFVGSTSAGLAGSARCPVIMISAASSPGETGGLGRIGVAVDASERQGVALRWAFEEARFRGAELHAVHVVPMLPAGIIPQRPLEPESTDSLMAAGVAAMEKLVGGVRADYPDVRLVTDVSLGSPVDVVVERSQDLDLVVTGAHGTGFPGFNLSGVVRGIMGHAQCPVAVVRTWPHDRFGIS